MNSGFHETFFRNFFKMFTAFMIMACFLYILSPFIVPFLFGGMLALALSPFLTGVMKKLNWSKKKALIIVTIVMVFIGAIPVSIFSIRGARIITEFFSQQSASGLTQKTQEVVYTFLDHFAFDYHLEAEMVKEKFNTFLNNSVAFVLKAFSNLVTQIPDLLLGFVVMILSFFFFLLKENHIRDIFDRYFYFTKGQSDKFISVLKSSCREVFFINVLTGILQSSIVSVGALICGLGDFYIIFFFTFIISFIPVIGAAPMAFVLAIYAFIDKQAGVGITMSIIGGVTGLADNLIRPYLASLGEVEVPAFIVFLAVIGGVIVMGLPGLFVGPLLASLMYGVLPIIIEDYFPPEVLAIEAEEEENNKAP